MEEQKKSPYVKTFNCPNCAGSVNIRAIGSSINVVCSYCSSIIDTNDENYVVIETFTNKIQRRQVMDLGQRGTLFGTLWENIGYMERVDQSGQYVWSEYLLFNPLKGFRWLTEYGGHWSFVTTTKDKLKYNPKKNYTIFKYKKKTYNIFNRGTATVQFVLGEFYWQVRIGEIVNLEEYISPPEILSVESTSEEVVWSIGQYVEADLIKTGFQIDKPMPFQSGIAPNQPSPITEENSKKIKRYWYAFLGLLFFIQIGFCVGTKSEKVYSGQIEISSTDTQKTKVTPQFEVKDTNTSLDISFSAPVDNSWLEVGVDLVNDDNGDTVEFETGIEYYHGTDSDGAWTEGSKSNSETIPSIAKGKYHLNLEIIGPGFSGSVPTSTSSTPMTLDIVVKTGATLWSNFFFALILVSLYPMYILWKRWKFEVTRWSESDFSPYVTAESEDSE